MAKRRSPKKKNNNSKIFISALAVVFVFALIFVVALTKKDYTNFATCLSDSGIVMAGTEWCPHCKAQKQLFKGAFEEVLIPANAYKDCDRQKQWCEDNQVTGYPTWILPDGNRLSGTQKLETLAKVTNCELA